jgi:hypothetical protein
MGGGSRPGSGVVGGAEVVIPLAFDLPADRPGISRPRGAAAIGACMDLLLRGDEMIDAAHEAPLALMRAFPGCCPGVLPAFI